MVTQACARRASRGHGVMGVMGSLGQALLLLSLLTGGLLQHADAATYWWNPATGLDTNNGLSSSTPWKSLKKVRDAGLTGGNTVNIVVGNYTRSQYQAAANDYPVWNQTQSRGSAGAPLVIQSDPAGGGTRAKFDGQGDGLWVNFLPNGAGPYYIVIKNIEFTNYAGGAINIGNSGTAFGGSQIATYLAVLDCYFHDFTQAGAAVTGTIAADHVIFKGNRVIKNAIGYTSGAADHVYYLSHGSNYIVITGNYAETIGGYHVHGWGGFDASWSSNNWIIRQNVTVNDQRAAVLVAGSIFSNLYIYQNTTYSEAATYPAIAGSSGITSAQAHISFHNGQISLTNTHVKNNLSYGSIDAGTGLVWSDAGFAPTNPFELDYNWWGYVGGGGAAYRWLNTAYTSNAAFQAATIYGDHDREGDPKFTNPASGVRDFTLQSTSTAIDTGTFLTTAVGAGTASTALTVGDAGYFHDGYGLIQGDTIQVGSALTVITGISGNTLTISPAISWVNGANVSLSYNGTAPDMGAFEAPALVSPTGPILGGVDFDGVDDYLDMSNTTAYQFPNTSFTVSGYFKASNDDGYVFARRIISGGNGGYFFRINNAGTATARIVDSSGGASAEATTSATTLKDGIKHCFVIVFTTSTTTPSGNQVTIYIDGTQDGTATGASTAYATNSNKWVAGAVSDLDPSGWLQGGVDDLRVWAGAFSIANAARYCAAKIHYFSMPMASVSYWPLDTCAEGASGGGVVFPDRMKGGSSATGVIGGNGTGLTCHGSNLLNYPASVE